MRHRLRRIGHIFVFKWFSSSFRSHRFFYEPVSFAYLSRLHRFCDKFLRLYRSSTRKRLHVEIGTYIDLISPYHFILYFTNVPYRFSSLSVYSCLTYVWWYWHLSYLFCFIPIPKRVSVFKHCCRMVLLSITKIKTWLIWWTPFKCRYCSLLQFLLLARNFLYPVVTVVLLRG